MPNPTEKQFIEAMDDDFNTPQALATLFDLARGINEAGDAGISIDKAQSVLVSLAREVLGLKLPRIVYLSGTASGTTRVSGKLTVIPRTVNTRVNRLVEERVKCREEKDWQRADEIRKKLAALGVTLEDTKTGTDILYRNVPSEESLDSLMKELGITL